MEPSIAAGHIQWAVTRIYERKHQPVSLKEIIAMLVIEYPYLYKDRSERSFQRAAKLAIEQGLIYGLAIWNEEDNFNKMKFYMPVGQAFDDKTINVTTKYLGRIPFEGLCRLANEPGNWILAGLGINLPRAFLGQLLWQTEAVKISYEPITGEEFVKFTSLSIQALQSFLDLLQRFQRMIEENEDIVMDLNEIPKEYQEEYKSIVVEAKKRMAEYERQMADNE